MYLAQEVGREKAIFGGWMAIETDKPQDAQ